MKKLFVLGAGLLQVPVIKKAREMGYYVIAADDDPNAPGMALAASSAMRRLYINMQRKKCLIKNYAK